MLTTASTVRILISVAGVTVRTRKCDTTVIGPLYAHILSDHFLSGRLRVRVRGSEWGGVRVRVLEL